jgi:N6-L-threonylcarbamoyladenine synthase
LCASLQQTILDILFIKLELAVQQEGITEIAIAGGVSANKGLRDRLQVYEKMNGWNIYVPEFQFCTDNAGMISVAGYYHFLESEFTDLSVSSEARSISF